MDGEEAVTPRPPPTRVERAERYATQARATASGANVERGKALGPTLATLALAEATLAVAESIDRLHEAYTTGRGW